MIISLRLSIGTSYRPSTRRVPLLSRFSADLSSTDIATSLQGKMPTCSCAQNVSTSRSRLGCCGVWVYVECMEISFEEPESTHKFWTWDDVRFKVDRQMFTFFKSTLPRVAPNKVQPKTVFIARGWSFLPLRTSETTNASQRSAPISQRSLINIPRYETPVYLTSESEATFEMKPLHLTVVIDVSWGFSNSDLPLFFSLLIFSGEWYLLYSFFVWSSELMSFHRYIEHVELYRKSLSNSRVKMKHWFSEKGLRLTLLLTNQDRVTQNCWDL